MIKYSLKCTDGHVFESWFASARAFDVLAQGGQLTCAVCGSDEVSKALMAPQITTSRHKTEPHEAAHDAPQGGATGATRPNLAAPASQAEIAMARFRAKVEANTEDVGPKFAAEARAIHDGSAPERAIRGQANLEDARALLEDGVPVVPLPFAPPRQVN